jgi:hypothetical protein
MARAFGNLMNRFMEDVKTVKPEVGMGATALSYSDRHAFTIINVGKDGKSFTMQQDIAKRTDNRGMSESQDYEYIADSLGIIREVRLGKDGRWHEVSDIWRTDKNHPDGGKWGKTIVGTKVVLVGVRDEYYDFSF